MRPRKYLTVDPTLIKFTQLLYSANCIHFSRLMNPTLLNSGNALANSDEDFIMMPTKIPNPFQLHYLIQPKYLGIFARNLTAMNQSSCGK